jgi:adenosylcobinamide-GDP ribazoletransferase
MRRDGLTLSITLLSVLPAAGGGAAGPRNSAAPDAAIPGPSRQTAGQAMAWAPVVGLLLGVLAAAVLYVCDHLLHAGSLVAAALSVGSLAVLTRALHLDGLADLADGLGSRRPAPAALEVMRRSDIGPFGVVTLVLTLLLQVAGLTQADAAGRGPAAVIVAAVTGRLALTWACRAGVPAARADGLGALVAGTVPPVVPALITAGVLAVTIGGIYLAAAVAAVPVEWILPVAEAAGLLVALVLAWHAVRRLGGITGDVLGALVETATAACLIVTAMS